ncbi:helicase HerA domain-containing protein [Gemmiger formicilis]|uniref:helicase HerA domain-containing protein n=1 Tax=Gemmiger formicilis TaxID=745368 RepID=UPI001D0E64CF|nr:DUF87 domain-containing protein [Gemmiger formicilis]MCC2194221.1 DUF87 domain-containing protein [Gemmiger formicilis]
MRLNEYASTRRTRGSYKIPTSVQKSIPIDEIYADGTWRSGEVYSQMWSVSDINYAMQSDDKKQDILAKMGRIYSNIPTDCWAQLCIVSQRMDEISFERDVLYHRANDGLDAYRVERNRLMKAYAKEIGNGLRRIASVRTMLTKGLCALVPFNVQEVMDAGGMFYGVNAVSGNLIVGLRSELPNGNGMVLGTSGSGKSLFVKLEILMLYLRFPNAKFYIVDPENEYAPLVHAMGGEVVDISPISETHFNPLDFYPDGKSKILPQNAKSEFVLSLFEKVMEGNMIPGDKSLIDRSLKNIYKPLVDSHYTISDRACL